MYAALTSVQSVKDWSKAYATADDKVILKIINRCSELIGRHCGRTNLGEVLSFSETRFVGSSASRFFQDRMWTLVLKAWPLVSLQSVVIGGNPVPILTAAQVQSGAFGVFIDQDGNEPRLIKFLGVSLMNPGMVILNYTAGYDGITNVPGGLQQACDQYVIEVLRSANNAMLKSSSMAGETTTYDTGDMSWGMSNRTLAMLQPYKDVAGWAL